MPQSPHSSHASGSCRPPTKIFGGRPPTEAFGGRPPTEAFGGRPPIEALAGGLEWRPSRLLAALLILLGLLAACAVLASEMPRAAAWCVAAAAWLHALRGAALECGKAPVRVLWDGNAGVVSVDGTRVTDAELHWRGPLAFLRWRDAQRRVHRLDFWPDVLDAQQRRALRLAAGSGDVRAAGQHSVL